MYSEVQRLIIDTQPTIIQYFRLRKYRTPDLGFQLITMGWVASHSIIKRIEVRTRLAVFTNRQCERDNGRLSVNSLAVIQIIRQAGVLLSKQWLVNENPSCADQQKRLLVVTTGRGQGLKFFRRSHFYSFDNSASVSDHLAMQPRMSFLLNTVKTVLIWHYSSGR